MKTTPFRVACTCTLFSLFLFHQKSYAVGEEWVPHIPSQNGPYHVSLLISNQSHNEGSLSLSDASGEDQFQLDLEPGETRVLNPGDLRFESTAWLTISEKTPGVEVLIRYDAADLQAPLVVPTAKEPAQTFRYRNFTPKDYWVGLAVVNLGARTGSVKVTQFDGNNRMLAETILTENLQPNQKFLSLLSGLELQEDPDGYIEVTTSQPSVSLVLMGSSPAEDKATLLAAAPINASPNYVRVSRSGGFAGSLWTVSFDESELCSKSLLGISSREICTPLADETQAQLLAFIDEGNGQEVELRLTQQPDFSCADQFFYQFEIVWNGRKNYFRYDECHVPLLTNGESTHQMVLKILALAEEKINEVSGDL